MSEQNLPQTGENAMSSFFILGMGFPLIIGGLSMFLLLLSSRKDNRK
ncbi:LPXTG cell wall anchor domain-containing protein [Lactococcus taiwanensis]|uniref:LPXTG cell wall anchor domain-containing protein n=1 Tax=Lactococcus taiwanensis TaxID=1151742 RepID=A0AA45QS27_9LACT|nr:LPXTG cell wall anchor domain-containing protein [Lactococcus taiwanensis]